MLSAAIVKRRASNWIVGSSFQWIQRIFERLLVLATHQWTKTPVCVNPSPLVVPTAGCFLVPTPRPWPFTSVGPRVFMEDPTSFPLPSSGESLRIKIGRFFNYYYGNFDSHKCTRQRISESPQLETHHFHVRKTEGKPHETGTVQGLL